jgi:phosphoglycerol transferase MdoB-like AlkP superfamily enzyme
MPFMSGLARTATIADNLTSQPYTTWTAAGSFLTRCGFPQIIRDPMYWENRKYAHITQMDRLPCYSDFLKLAGYDLYSYHVGSTQIMGIKAFFKSRGYQTFDVSDHSMSQDWDLVDFVLGKLPEIMKRSRETERPFVLDLITENMHPPYGIDQRCEIGFTQEFPRELKSASCFDQVFERFVKGLGELNISGQNAEMVVHSDHICWGEHPGIYDERKLVVLFPFRKKQRISKPGTYYDIPPTVLDILNISYTPEFAFGKSLFDEEVGQYPNVMDFGFIHSLLAKYTTYTSEGEVQCKGQKGFCTGYM